MDITEKEMNRNAVKNAVKTDITDEERLADLFGDCITDSERLKKVRDVLWEINNSGYCDSMAWELSTGSPSAQARYWQMNAERRDVLEREFDRLTQIVETYIGEKDEDNLPHGRGTKYCQNGGRYEGEWRHGVRCGVGTLYRANGEMVYSGEWQNDRYWGKGVLVDYRGIRKEGTFAFGNLDSNCDAVVLFPDGGLNAFSKRKRIAAGRAAGCAVTQTGTHCSATGTACIIPKAGAFTPLLKAERLKDTGKKAAKTVLLNILRRTERRRNAAIGTTRNRAFHKSEKKRGKRIETRA